MNTPRTVEPGFRSRKVSEGQIWNSEDIRLYSFRVFFGPWQAVLTKVGYISKAPMCAGRLEAVTHWLRYGRFVPRLSGNSYCGIRVEWPFMLALWIFFGLTGSGYAHSGIVDGYGCHRGTDKVSYHCHQGEFIGRTFKSKEDFLRQLRGGKSEHLSPKSNPPRIEKKQDE